MTHSPVHRASRHTLVLGKTGAGKSTLLRTVAANIVGGTGGILLVDPHGDLAESVITDIPRHRRNDLVVMDASRPSTCRGLNPLRQVSLERRALAVSTVLATMHKLWTGTSWGPRTEHVLRMALLALTEVRGATLLDARRMLIEEAHRYWVLKQVTDDLVRSFWAVEFPGYGKNLLPEVAAPILNKLGAILAVPAIREIVTRHRPALDARACMDRGRIVIASLSKGRIGEDAALLLGGLIIGAFQHATMARADAPAEARTPFTMMVDEIGSFATGPFLELLAEARKYGVFLVLATQSLAALDEQVRHALLGNTGTLVAFRAGGEDAEILQKEFVGRFGPQTLMNLDIGECAVRSGNELARILRITPVEAIARRNDAE
jgi:hypothetical protein